MSAIERLKREIQSPPLPGVVLPIPFALLDAVLELIARVEALEAAREPVECDPQIPGQITVDDALEAA